jgi:hypothetical protein
VPTTAVTVLAFTAHPYMGLWAQGRPWNMVGIVAAQMTFKMDA